MSVSALVRAVEELSDPESPDQLAKLDAALCAASPSECGRACATKLLRLFERFPEADGFGVFWSVVHFLEAGAEYEGALVESVRRAPSEFGLTLVTRMINSGVEAVGSERLMSVVNWLAMDPSVGGEVRRRAFPLRAQRRR